VKRTNIYLEEEQSRLLRHLAIEAGRSFTAIVREALDDYLAQRGIRSATGVIGPRRLVPEEEWQATFRAALERVRAGAEADMSTEEIEAEIAAAREEVRRGRATRTRAASG